MSAPTDEQLDDLAALLVGRLSDLADRTPTVTEGNRRRLHPEHMSLGTKGRHGWLSDRDGLDRIDRLGTE